MDQDKKNKIITLLKERGVSLPCPRCGNTKFGLIDGYINPSLGKEITAGLIIGGATLPSVATVCEKCGFVSHHALGALGLLPSKRKEGE